jgi:hypothetical protein
MLTGNPPAFERMAEDILRNDRVFIHKSTLQAAFRILRVDLDYRVIHVVEGLRRLGGLVNVQFEDPQCVATALEIAEFCGDSGPEFHDVLSFSAARGFGSLTVANEKTAKQLGEYLRSAPRIKQASRRRKRRIHT